MRFGDHRHLAAPGQCPKTHRSQSRVSLVGKVPPCPHLLPARPWGTWHLVRASCHHSIPWVPWCGRSLTVGAAGTWGAWHTLPWLPSSAQATPGKDTKLSPPGTELLPFLDMSVPTGSAQAMPSPPQPPSEVAQKGHNLSPKGLQQFQGLAPTF